ncbi:hypothetical protein ASE02_08710 [Phenylobacterium sp. Root700]|nr:hypothetical protein ASE02_08710 [Phenylobacterium sp. Root700]
MSWTDAQIGVANQVDFNGIVGGVVTAGLTGQVTYTLQSIGGGGDTWVFGYSVLNTSSAPIDASRISIFGFDVTPDILSSTSTGTYDTWSSGNVAQLGFREACYSAVNCGGGAGVGALLGGPALTGTFSLVFAADQTSLSLENLFVRYQSINSEALGLNGGSGAGVPTTVVPEPATWAMMIIGFGAAGAMIRRARREKLAVI